MNVSYLVEPDEGDTNQAVHKAPVGEGDHVTAYGSIHLGLLVT